MTARSEPNVGALAETVREAYDPDAKESTIRNADAALDALTAVRNQVQPGGKSSSRSDYTYPSWLDELLETVEYVEGVLSRDPFDEGQRGFAAGLLRDALRMVRRIRESAAFTDEAQMWKEHAALLKEELAALARANTHRGQVIEDDANEVRLLLHDAMDWVRDCKGYVSDAIQESPSDAVREIPISHCKQARDMLARFRALTGTNT